MRNGRVECRGIGRKDGRMEINYSFKLNSIKKNVILFVRLIIRIMTREKTKEVVNVSEKEVLQKRLILFNDDVNSFDFVIDSLVEVCEHNPMQAENCAMIAHYKGRCSVKNGSINELEPIHSALCDRQLTVEIQ